MKMVLRSLDKRSDEKKSIDRATFEWMVDTLSRGEVLTVDGLPG